MTTTSTIGIPLVGASSLVSRSADVGRLPAANTAAPAPVTASPLLSSVAVVQGLEQVQQAIERLKQSIKPSLANTLNFQIDESTGKTVVKILDVETNTVVRQIPSEEILTIARALDRMQGRGGLVKQQA